LQEFPRKDKGDITARQLLNHTSGIPHYKSNFGIFNFTHYNNSTDALNRFKDRDLEFEPGTSFLYSSYGYTLLGAIIENVSGMPYRDYMRENIWIPAGMSRTDIEESHQRYENKAGLYIRLGTVFIKGPKNDLSYTYSGGGIHSTAEDLLRFGKAILNYDLISKVTTELILELPGLSTEKREYSYGWDYWTSSKHGNIIEHNGTQIGASSFFRVYFEKNTVVAVLANSLNSSDAVRNLAVDLSYSLIESQDEF
jgi:CubicO group peptidase (beta-lactamase class C family)